MGIFRFFNSYEIAGFALNAFLKLTPKLNKAVIVNCPKKLGAFLGHFYGKKGQL